MRNSPRRYTIPKGERFSSAAPDTNTELTDLPPIDRGRYCTMGHGQRGQYLREADSTLPSPMQYSIVSEFDRKNPRKGASFGLSHLYLGSHIIRSAAGIVSKETAELPGPGQYTPLRARSLARVTLKSRIQEPQRAAMELPGPGVYKPMYALVEQGRYKGVSFGVGGRSGSKGTFCPL